MEKFFVILIVFLIDFLFTAVGLWVITLILGALGLAIQFTWGLAFAVWLIIKILKMIF